MVVVLKMRGCHNRGTARSPVAAAAAVVADHGHDEVVEELALYLLVPIIYANALELCFPLSFWSMTAICWWSRNPLHHRYLDRGRESQEATRTSAVDTIGPA